jgi:N-acetylmuramoyl-L-alanine amidase
MVSFGEVIEPIESDGNVVSTTTTQAVLITPDDVSRGILFCRDYPVITQINGVTIPTADNDVPPLIIASRTLIPVRAFFESMGAKVIWDDENRVVSLEDEDNTVNLFIDSQVALVNGAEKILEVPAMIIDDDGDGNGSTMVPLRFVSEVLGAEVSWADDTRTANIIPGVKPTTDEIVPNGDLEFDDINLLNENARQKLIVIDIGHGGNDSGSIGNQDLPDELYEKDVNLEIGLKVKELLNQVGARYIFTRESDVAMSLYDRPALANDNGADIFISIHNNASEKSSPEGTEIYYYSKVNELGQNEEELYGIYSKYIAQCIQTKMAESLGTNDRGIKENQFLAVLNKTSMPAIVIEGAFMSNPSDLEKIRTPEYKQNYAYSLVKGLVEAMNSAY